MRARVPSCPVARPHHGPPARWAEPCSRFGGCPVAPLLGGGAPVRRRPSASEYGPGINSSRSASSAADRWPVRIFGAAPLRPRHWPEGPLAMRQPPAGRQPPCSSRVPRTAERNARPDFLASIRFSLTPARPLSTTTPGTNPNSPSATASPIRTRPPPRRPGPSTRPCSCRRLKKRTPSHRAAVRPNRPPGRGPAEIDSQRCSHTPSVLTRAGRDGPATKPRHYRFGRRIHVTALRVSATPTRTCPRPSRSDLSRVPSARRPSPRTFKSGSVTSSASRLRARFRSAHTRADLRQTES